MSEGDADAIKYMTATCAVFLDAVDFPIPDSLGRDAVYNNMKSSIEKESYSGELSIMAYVDGEKPPVGFRGYDDNSCFTIHPREEDKSARVLNLLLDIGWWVTERGSGFDQSVKLFVFSNDTEDEAFHAEVERLTNLNYKVVKPSNLLNPKHFEWLLKNQVDGGEPKPKKPKPTPLEPTMSEGDAGSVTMSEGDADGDKNITVFVDALAFPVTLPSLYWQIKEFLAILGYCGEISVMAYDDNEILRFKIGDDIFSDRSRFIHALIGDKSKSARVHAMLVDIVLWALENPATHYQPRNLIVISKGIKDETDFLSALEALKYRYYNLLLVVSHPLSSSKLPTLSFDRFCYSDFQSTGCLDFIRGAFACAGYKPRRKEDTVAFVEALSNVSYRETWPCVHFHEVCDIKAFWDGEGFPADRTEDLLENMGTSLHKKGYFGEVSIRAYLNKGNTDVKVKKYALQDPLWEVSIVTEEDEYAKGTRMLLDIIFWAMNRNESPVHLMLISKPFEGAVYKRVCEALKGRCVNLVLEPLEVEKLTTKYFDSHIRPKQDENVKRWGFDRCSANYDVAFFMDVKDWPITDPDLFFWNIRRTLDSQGYRGDVSFLAYGSEGDELFDKLKKSNSCGVPVAGGEASIVTKMLMDMIFVAGESLRIGERFRPKTLMVISSPLEQDKLVKYWKKSLDRFKERGFKVIVGDPDWLWITFGIIAWSAKSLFEGGDG